MRIQRVGLAGCGLMGSGIAEAVARAGYQVRVSEIDDSAVASGRDRIRGSLARAVEREKIDEAERDEALGRIDFTTRVEDLSDSDLVIEAVVEEFEAKEALFRTLDSLCSPRTIFATNTSSLPVTDLAASVERADRVVGLHFFNPVPVMKLVEVIRTIVTSDDTYEQTLAFARSLGKEAITTRDASGFVVNLLLVPFILDAIRQLEHGVASVADIDSAMVLGLGHPMGPLKLSDFVGLDTLLRISEIMYKEYREDRYAPPPLLKRMVALGRYGRKVGVGFYEYSGDEPVPIEL